MAGPIILLRLLVGHRVSRVAEIIWDYFTLLASLFVSCRLLLSHDLFIVFLKALPYPPSDLEIGHVIGKIGVFHLRHFWLIIT